MGLFTKSSVGWKGLDLTFEVDVLSRDLTEIVARKTHENSKKL